MTKKIGFAQFEVQFGERETNLLRVKDLIDGAGEFDLLVLPELCFTGYEFKDRDEVASLAEPCRTGPTASFLREVASARNSVFVAGYAESADGKFYNSSMMVLPSGEIHNYRKIQLFSRENDLFSAGDAPPRAFDTPAGRIGMMICFDWFFPEVARLLTIDGAQVIAHPSNLVLPWCQRAMFARSVENHVYSITANRIGTEDRAGRSLTFTGGSQVLGCNGETLIAAETQSESVSVVDVDVGMASDKQLNPYNNLITSRRADLFSALLPGSETS